MGGRHSSPERSVGAAIFSSLEQIRRACESFLRPAGGQAFQRAKSQGYGHSPGV